MSACHSQVPREITTESAIQSVLLLNTVVNLQELVRIFDIWSLSQCEGYHGYVMIAEAMVLAAFERPDILRPQVKHTSTDIITIENKWHLLNVQQLARNRLRLLSFLLDHWWMVGSSHEYRIQALFSVLIGLAIR